MRLPVRRWVARSVRERVRGIRSSRWVGWMGKDCNFLHVMYDVEVMKEFIEIVNGVVVVVASWVQVVGIGKGESRQGETTV